MSAKAGDYIVLFRYAGGCDLFKIDAAGTRVAVRANLASPQDARRLARTSLGAGSQIWVCDEGTPNLINLY